MGWLRDIDQFRNWDTKQALKSLKRDGGLQYALDRVFRNEGVMRQYEAETGNDSKHPKQARDIARAALLIGAAYGALAGAGAGAAEAGAGSEGYLAAADAHGGLVPAYGSNSAYQAGIGGGSGFDWARVGSGFQQAGNAWQRGGVGRDVPEAEEVDYYTLVEDPRLGSEYYSSSRGLKVPSRGSGPVQRGLRGEHPIDDNGVQIAMIQELTKKIRALEARIAEVKRRRGNG